MNVGPDKDSDMISPGQLNAQLRLLAGIQPPKALRDRLVAAIPPTGAREVGRSVACRSSKAVSWAGVAVAAVVVFAAAFWLLPPTGRSLPSIADINDRAAAAAMADANFPRPQDSNTYDNNAL